MKNLYFIFVLFIFPYVGESQDTVKRSIQLLKESANIDSLLSSLINCSKGLGARKNDSCLLLNLSRKGDENFLNGLHTLNSRNIIFDLGRNLEKSNPIGYFEFRGYLVFVAGDLFMNKFFTYSSSEKEFRLVKPKFKEIDFTHWNVIYKNGGLYLYYGVH